MMPLSRCLFVLLLTGIIAGCGGSGAETSTIAIVDMDTVLTMTGRDLTLQTALQERSQQIRTKLNDFQQGLEKAFADKQKSFGETPTDEQKQELQDLFNQLNLQNERAKASTEQNLRAFQQEIYQQFQSEVNAVCLELARSQGYELVLAKSPQVLAYSNTIDITDAVVEQVKQLKTDAPVVGGTQPPTAGGSAIPGLMPSTNTPIAPPAQPGNNSLTPSGSTTIAPVITPPATTSTPAAPAESSTPAPANSADSAPEPTGTSN
ncbi:MAG: OmpH family outer membrane protein [Planctomycetaceae bacterium]|nr:OmpH family outer membrane protein [Planctomycetaceae bacterium]